MADKMKRILAWVMVVTLITGQLALPAVAEETEEDTALGVIVDVVPVPEAPAAESQAPAESSSITVTNSESAATTSSDGVTEQKNSVTTNWSGAEGGTITSGYETTTTVTGIDNVTGQMLYEGGSTEGSETTTTIETSSDTQTEEGFVTREITTNIESGIVENGSAEVTGSEISSTDSTGWKDVNGEYAEGDFVAEKTESHKKVSETTSLGSEEIPESGIVIDLTPSKNGTHSGTSNGEVIPLEESINIPEGASLVKDKDGNVIGYTYSTTTETITGTETRNGEARLDGTSSSTDIAVVTPNLDAAGIRIDNNTKIDEETDESGKVTAYVVTNTTKETYKTDAIGQLTRPESGAFLQEDGSTITRAVEDITNTNGEVIGMKITNVHIGTDGKELSRSETTQLIVENPIPEAKSTTTYTLPSRPEASAKTEDGITTTVTVTDILDEKGEVIGFKSITVQTDENGAELYREEKNLYGTEETADETVTTDNARAEGFATVMVTTVETTRVTAEETTFTDVETYTRLNRIVNDMTVEQKDELVMIDGKLYYIYSGSVTVTEGEDHGDISLMNPVTPMSNLFMKNSDLDLDQGGDIHAADSNAPEEGFKYIGHGIDSALTVNKQSGSASANQFRLKSADGKVYFALCIDFDTSIKAGHLYDIKDIESADYLSNKTAERIRAIALNGYWGTESGIGSMADVQSLLVEYLTTSKSMTEAEAKKIADSLTPGQALAATQAALWKFGDSGNENPVLEDNLIGNRDNSSTDEINAEYLYKALVAKAENPTFEINEGVEFLDAEDITATSIVVKDKVASAGDAGNTSGKDVYKTDLNFTLGIEPTKLFGDLKVTVYDNEGNGIKTVILASKDTTLIGLKPDANGMYTIPDIEIAEGVTVNLKLYGTQDLGTGVYIYTSLDGSFNDSQTLVTLATGSRKVDLDIAMKLNVQEPTVTRERTGETRYGKRTDTQLQTKTDTTKRKSTTTKSEWEKKTGIETDSLLTYAADVTLDKVSTRKTVEEKNWKFAWMKNSDPVSVEYLGDFQGDPEILEKTMEIIDDPVPLAKAPKTGDASALWAVLSVLALGGMGLLNRKRRNEE